MNPIVAKRKQDLARLCEEHRVARLDVFGSAVTGEFDPETSDLDFLVTFHESAAGGKDAFDKQIGLRDALEGLFGRKVDVVPERSITNPYFRANVEDTREAVYPNWENSTNAAGRGNKTVIMRRIRCSLLSDIVESAEQICEWTEGRTLRGYLRDRLIRGAIERVYITVGECMAQLEKRTPDTAARFTNYREVIDLRDAVLCLYPKIDDERVWAHAVDDLPTLLREARALLAEYEEDE